MNILVLVATLLGQVALIARDPALGARGQAITEALTLLAGLLAKGEAARAELEALSAHIQQMVAEGRDPTEEEWEALRDRARANHQILNPDPDA